MACCFFGECFSTELANSPLRELAFGATGIAFWIVGKRSVEEAQCLVFEELLLFLLCDFSAMISTGFYIRVAGFTRMAL